MAHILQLRLFGTPAILLNGKPAEGFVTRKALALFIYIATSRHVHLRDKLASLFWRDVAEQQAKNSLRRVLPNLRQLVGYHLIIDRQSIGLDERQPVESDVETLRRAVAALPALSLQAQNGWEQVNLPQLENALALYQGDFLDGFYVDDAPAFEEWVSLQREELRELALRGFTFLAEYYLTQNNYQAGLATTQRLLTIEPWYETGHHQRMLLFARSGQRVEALAQYETCRAFLANEFRLQPSTAMTALYEQIKAETYVSEHAAVAPVVLRQPIVHPTPSPIAETPALALPKMEPHSPASTPQTNASRQPFTQKIDWGEMPRPSFFAGRQAELH